MRSRLWLALAILVALWVAPLASGMHGTTAAKPAAIERNLENALAKAKAARVLQFRRHRTNTRPGVAVVQVEWANLATSQRRVLDYDASGRPTNSRLFSPPNKPPSSRWNPSGACGCDLDPFTNFPGQALRVSLVGEQAVDGQPTFHLRFTVTGGPETSITDFWIDRSTYLPVRSKVVYRMVGSNGQLGPPMSTTDEFTWLPRTTANLAHVAAA